MHLVLLAWFAMPLPRLVLSIIADVLIQGKASPKSVKSVPTNSHIELALASGLAFELTAMCQCAVDGLGWLLSRLRIF